MACKIGRGNDPLPIFIYVSAPAGVNDVFRYAVWF